MALFTLNNAVTELLTTIDAHESAVEKLSARDVYRDVLRKRFTCDVYRTLAKLGCDTLDDFADMLVDNDRETHAYNASFCNALGAVLDNVRTSRSSAHRSND